MSNSKRKSVQLIKCLQIPFLTSSVQPQPDTVAIMPANVFLSGLGRQTGWTRSLHCTSRLRLIKAMSSASWRVTYDGYMTIWLTRNNLVCLLSAPSRLCSATLTWICDALRLKILRNAVFEKHFPKSSSYSFRLGIYLRTQWAAVMTHFLLIKAPPQ